MTPADTFDLPECLAPISPARPCGDNLEYDSEYALLQTRLAPQMDVQYGDFTLRPDSPDWADIERECRRLLLRAKDISLLIWLTRCRARRNGATGLCEGLNLLWLALRQYPLDIHPQKHIDGQTDPIVRANALAALTDSEGLLADVRDLVIVPAAAARLTVRDVERALLPPRQADALPAESVQAQLTDLYHHGQSERLALARSLALVRGIRDWSREDLGDDAPDLGPLLRLLDKFGPPPATDTLNAPTPPADLSPTPEASPSPHTPPGKLPPTDTRAPSLPVPLTNDDVLAQRERARQAIRQAHAWFAHHEPSSPVAILLKQADRLVGKRFVDVINAIPLELLAQWDAESEQP